MISRSDLRAFDWNREKAICVKKGVTGVMERKAELGITCKYSVNGILSVSSNDPKMLDVAQDVLDVVCHRAVAQVEIDDRNYVARNWGRLIEFKD